MPLSFDTFARNKSCVRPSLIQERGSQRKNAPFAGLPSDVLVHLSSWLQNREVESLQITCKGLMGPLKSNAIWRIRSHAAYVNHGFKVPRVSHEPATQKPGYWRDQYRQVIQKTLDRRALRLVHAHIDYKVRSILYVLWRLSTPLLAMGFSSLVVTPTSLLFYSVQKLLQLVLPGSIFSIIEPVTSVSFTLTRWCLKTDLAFLIAFVSAISVTLTLSPVLKEAAYKLQRHKWARVLFRTVYAKSRPPRWQRQNSTRIVLRESGY